MLHMDLLDPPLTAVRQSIHELGRRGARVLLDLLAGKAETDVIERVPVELILRGSVAPPKPAVGSARLVKSATGGEPR
jgi:LacI family transcriptional regulator